ncbi:MAG: carbohydrate kinase family protein [Betaproteobacteria bacterium]|nr:carbohydrate kinase family protein [Betaproteobacteria bacterium]NDF73592.1 carbohydrate kinase family protein [Betaproteobacteria bacterium]
MRSDSPAVLISGSIAFDFILLFDGKFRDHILADRIHMLNVAFLTPSLQRQDGGCAANIAYTLAKLGGWARLLGSVGHDAKDYLKRLASYGIDLGSVIELDDCYSAQAFITTDMEANQITAFHPGAMNLAHELDARQAIAACASSAWGIVSPNGKLAMLEHARAFAEAGLPFIFDPGQGLPMFSGEELLAVLELADALIVNDYEASMLMQKTGLQEAALAKRLKALVITRGAEGSRLMHQGDAIDIAAAAAQRLVDPTGCGDAFRGAALFALSKGCEWDDAVRLGTILGTIKIEHAGAQNHPVSPAELSRRWTEHFGTPMPAALL